MELTAEQIAELQAKAKEADELRERLEALDGNKNKVLDEYKQTKQKLKELEEAEAARRKKELEEQGKLQELLELARKDAEEARKRADEIEKEKEEALKQTAAQRLRSDFMAGAGGEFFNPDHAWTVFGGAVEDQNGKTVVLYKGSAVSPAEFVKRLRSDEQHAYMLKPAKKGGMGAPPSGGTTPPEASGNPYISGNVTQRLMLELENPEEAARLQSEAKAFLASQAKR
jgi:hypothetical protein